MSNPNRSRIAELAAEDRWQRIPKRYQRVPNVLKDSPRVFVGRADELNTIERALPLGRVRVHGIDDLPPWLQTLREHQVTPVHDGTGKEPVLLAGSLPVSDYAVLLTAPPGAGKSSLLQAFMNKARASGRTALRVPARTLADDKVFARGLRDTLYWRSLGRESDEGIRRRVENAVITAAEAIGLGAISHQDPAFATLVAPFQGTTQRIIDAIRSDRELRKPFNNRNSLAGEPNRTVRSPRG